MKFDEVLTEIGEFGSYQRRLYFLLCLPAINAGIFMVISVFTLGVPDHRCALPGFDNDTFEIQDPGHQMLVNQFIPESTDDQHKYDQCHVITGAGIYDNNSRPLNGTKETCSQWVYDKTDFKATFVTRENLICDQEVLPSVAKMIFFAGVLVGALGFGILSDVIGRKKTLYLSFILVLASSIALAWAQNFVMYVVLRFIIGAANAGIFMTGFVIGMELVGPSKRMWAGIVIEYFFAIGLLVLAMVGYFLRDWKYIEMIVSFPNVLYLSYWCSVDFIGMELVGTSKRTWAGMIVNYFFTVGLLVLAMEAYFLRDWKYIEMANAFPMLFYLSYWWFIPESPRWLLSQGRIEEAEAILQKAAKVNKATLPNKIFDEDSMDTGRPQGQLWNLFSSKTLAFRTLVIFFNWMVVSMVYYGLSLNTGNLGGDFYLNFTLSGLVEFPAYTLCLLLLDRMGRKWLHCVVMVVGGVACISTVFTTIYGGEDLHALTVTLAMLGKLGAAAAFAVIYVFSAELYPTIVRNAGMGASSCCARIGGMVAPYIADLNKVVSGDFGRALPLVIFGGFSVAAGIMALFLPETLHKELPETIEDGKQFGKSKSDRSKHEVYINDAYFSDSKTAAHGSLDTKTEQDDVMNMKM